MKTILSFLIALSVLPFYAFDRSQNPKLYDEVLQERTSDYSQFAQGGSGSGGSSSGGSASAGTNQVSSGFQGSNVDFVSFYNLIEADGAYIDDPNHQDGYCAINLPSESMDSDFSLSWTLNAGYYDSNLDAIEQTLRILTDDASGCLDIMFLSGEGHIVASIWENGANLYNNFIEDDNYTLATPNNIAITRIGNTITVECNGTKLIEESDDKFLVTGDETFLPNLSTGYSLWDSDKGTQDYQAALSISDLSLKVSE